MDKVSEAILLSQIRRVEPGAVKVPSRNTDVKGPSFDEILEKTGVQISKHAERRLQSRNIDLSGDEIQKLESAMSSLEKKGARDSLVLMGELAFIVNVPSKTVVTALAKEQMKEQVFTNIDSTMLV